MKWLKIFTKNNMQNSDKDLQEGDTALILGQTLEKDIGEPVMSFVECVKANHKRFSFTKVGRRPIYAARCTYNILDRHTDEEWRVTTDWRTTRKFTCQELDWLTDDETKYLVSEISDFYNKRTQRLIEIRNKRFRRTQSNERKRLMGVYCK